jgi:hypothetical protein
MNRKQRRTLARQNKGADTQNFSDKISQFNKLPEQCSACEKEFDRKNREMLQSWNVVAKQEVVRLFCPDCMTKAKEVIEKHGGTNERSTPVVRGSQEDT